MTGELLELVHAAINEVHDPCSIATDRRMSIAELGLVVAVDAGADGGVSVVVRTTAPSCVLIGSIMQAVDDKVSAVPGVTSVTVDLDTHATWSEELMTESGRTKLRLGRAQAQQRLGLQPWSSGRATAAAGYNGP
jgi:metal-sulfur cluster biosynthetic enzyme